MLHPSPLFSKIFAFATLFGGVFCRKKARMKKQALEASCLGCTADGPLERQMCVWGAHVWLPFNLLHISFTFFCLFYFFLGLFYFNSIYCWWLRRKAQFYWKGFLSLSPSRYPNIFILAKSITASIAKCGRNVIGIFKTFKGNVFPRFSCAEHTVNCRSPSYIAW